MEDLDELLKLEVPAFHGVRAAGRCADASLEHSRLGGREPQSAMRFMQT